MLKNSTIKNSGITLTRQLDNLPSSMYHNEEYQNPVDPFTRKVDINKCMDKNDFDYYQNPEILL
jgi:hypothetical protein